MVLIEFIAPLKSLITRAGAEIMEFYRQTRQFKVMTKADNSPLTQADLLSNDLIMAGLQQLTPDYPVLSEESVKPAFALRKTWRQYWLVDPLDGTREFVRHTGEFVVNIALIRGHEPVLGMIYAPAHDIGFYAIKQQGAFRWQNNGQEQQIHTRCWQSGQTKLLTSRGAKLEHLEKYFGCLGQFTWDASGSAIKFCRLAEGLADAYPRFGDTCEWDTAAGQIILQEAGGALVDFNWQPLRYNSKSSLLNPHFIAVGDKAFIEQLKGEDTWQKNE